MKHQSCHMKVSSHTNLNINACFYAVCKLKEQRHSDHFSNLSILGHPVNIICNAFFIDQLKLDPHSYCKCGCCRWMEKLEESFCCHSKMTKMNEGKGNICIIFLFYYFGPDECITGHELFKKLLDPVVLEVNLR